MWPARQPIGFFCIEVTLLHVLKVQARLNRMKLKGDCHERYRNNIEGTWSESIAAGPPDLVPGDHDPFCEPPRESPGLSGRGTGTR